MGWDDGMMDIFGSWMILVDGRFGLMLMVNHGWFVVDGGEEAGWGLG